MYPLPLLTLPGGFLWLWPLGWHIYDVESDAGVRSPKRVCSDAFVQTRICTSEVTNHESDARVVHASLFGQEIFLAAGQPWTKQYIIAARIYFSVFVNWISDSYGYKCSDNVVIDVITDYYEHLVFQICSTPLRGEHLVDLPRPVVGGMTHPCKSISWVSLCQ